MALYVNGDNVTYFVCFGVKHISKVIKKIICNTIIMKNILRIQANDSLISGYFCTGFAGFLLKSINLWGYTNIFSTTKSGKNHKIILKFFQ